MFMLKQLLLICAASLVLAQSMCGCRTYFGSDNIVKTETISVSEKEQNNRLHCFIDAGANGVKITLVEKYEIKKVEDVRRHLIGYKHFYADFESENTCPLYVDDTPFEEYDSFCGGLWNGKSVCNRWCTKGIKVTHKALGELPWGLIYFPTWPASYPMVFLGGLTGALMCDMGAWMFALCADGCVYAVRGMTWCGLLMWNGIVSPFHWLGARSFGNFRSWKLRENKPGILRMISYMPFVNLFCFAQTPPYLNDNPMVTEDEYFEPELLAVEKTSAVTEMERRVGKRVKISLLSPDGKKLASGYFTPDSKSVVNIYELGGKALVNSSADMKKFTLTAEVDGKQVTRELEAKLFVSPQAAGDWQIFCDGKTDIRSRISAWQRSHKYWRLSEQEREQQRRILKKYGYDFCLE